MGIDEYYSFAQELESGQDNLQTYNNSLTASLTSNVQETTDTTLKTYIALNASATKLTEENALLTAQLLKTNNFYLSNNRETYYQSQLIDHLNAWNKLYLFLYFVFFISYAFITFFIVPASFNVFFLGLFIALPFLSTFVGNLFVKTAVKVENGQFFNPVFNMMARGNMNETYLT